MSTGLRAMMKAASDEALPFRISMYVGSLVVAGRVAPASDWYEVAKAAAGTTAANPPAEPYDAMAERYKRRRGEVDPPRIQIDQEAASAVVEWMTWIEQAEDGVNDELTLVDAVVLPAIQATSGTPGGQRLPVMRIPLASIDAWWLVEGSEIRGRTGMNFGIGVGALFPIGDGE